MYYASKRLDYSQERPRASSNSRADSNRKGISLTHRSKDNSREHTRVSVSGHEESQSHLSMLRSGSAGSILNKESKKGKQMTNGDKVRYKIKMITSASQPKEKAGVLIRALEQKSRPFPPDVDSTLMNLGNKERSYSKPKIGTPAINNPTPVKNYSFLQSSRSSVIHPKKTLKEFNLVLEQLKKRREDTINQEHSARRINTSVNDRSTSRERYSVKENQILRSISREKLRPRFEFEKSKEQPKYKENYKGKENQIQDELESGSVIIKDVEQQYFFETIDMKQLEAKTRSVKILEPQKIGLNRPSPQPRPSTSKERSKDRSPKPNVMQKVQKPQSAKENINSKEELRKKTPIRDFKEILKQKNGVLLTKKPQPTTPLRKSVTPQRQPVSAKVHETKVQFFNTKPAYVVPTEPKNQSKPSSRPTSVKRAVKVESNLNRRQEFEASVNRKSVKLSDILMGTNEGYGKRMMTEDSEQKWLNISVLDVDIETNDWEKDRMYGRAIRTEADECYEYNIKPTNLYRRKL